MATVRTMRITARGWSVLVVSTAVGVIGRLLGSLELLCAGLAGAFTFAAAIVLATASRRPHVHFERRVPAEVFADDEVCIELVASSGSRRTPTLTVEEHTGPDASRTFGLAAMQPHRSRTIRYDFAAGGRGIRLLGPCAVTRTDRVGFTRRACTIGGATSMIVWPRPRLADIPDTYAKLESVPASVATAGIDRDLLDIRPFVDGDELRRIHWRTTARTGQLMVRSDATSIERARPLIVLDARERAHTAGSLELALALVCGYAMTDSYAPQVTIATRLGATSHTERAGTLDALAGVPVAGGRPQAVEALVVAMGDIPDLLVAGPHTEVQGMLCQARVVLRCSADGVTYTVSRNSGQHP